MKRDCIARSLRATLLVTDPQRAAVAADMLEKRGIHPTIATDPEALLRKSRTCAPHLVIVEDGVAGVSGARLLADLLEISWTTATILICDDDETAVHDKTEGLGILGSVRSVEDSEGLNRLLDSFVDLASHDR
ncbi:MAG TPA: hypothetical protein VK463_01555 [Desulfomonilaceae bacterium]|nr:hypothetical protein [Desulfomonilaceae bacterium]